MGKKNLIIKTSSLGDIIHTLPALTDAAQVYPAIQFDWVVEENFAEIPAWHPNVKKVIPMAWRRWRKNLFDVKTYKELKSFYQQLRSEPYDRVIDFQGLIKSALITSLTPGPRYGLDRQSAREPLASFAYHHHCTVHNKQHAVIRMRQLMASALNYPVPTTPPNYNLRLPPAEVDFSPRLSTGKSVIFLHGTTWETKLWPEPYWIQLARFVTNAGYAIYIPWSNPTEKQRAERIAAISPLIHLLPPLTLSQIAGVLGQATAVVAVDTGLGHLAAALNVPTLSLYGPTNPAVTGTVGAHQTHLSAQFPACAPCLQPKCTYTEKREVTPACFGTISPDTVWESLKVSLSSGC